MPDERTRIHGRLAEILQARVEADADPGLATLSRLAFHWNAAHDLPRTLAASVARRTGRETTGSRRGRHPARTRTVAVGPGPRRRGRGRPPAGRARRPPGRGGSRAGGRGALAHAAPHGGGDARTRPRPVAGQPRLLRVGPLPPSRGRDRQAGGDPARHRVRRRLPDRGAGTGPERPVAVSEPARPVRRQCRSRTTSRRGRQDRGVRRSRGGCPSTSDPSPASTSATSATDSRGWNGPRPWDGQRAGSGRCSAGSRCCTWRPDRSIVACPSRMRASRRGWPWDFRSRRPCAGVRRWWRSCGSAASTRQNGGSRSSMASDCPRPARAGRRRARSCCWHEATRTRRPLWSTRPSHLRTTWGGTRGTPRS